MAEKTQSTHWENLSKNSLEEDIDMGWPLKNQKGKSNLIKRVGGANLSKHANFHEYEEISTSSISSLASFSDAVLRGDTGSTSNESPENTHSRNCSCSTCKGSITESNNNEISPTYQQNNIEAINPLLLVSSSFGDITKNYLNGSENLYYSILDIDATVPNYGGPTSLFKHWNTQVMPQNSFTMFSPN